MTECSSTSFVVRVVIDRVPRLYTIADFNLGIKHMFSLCTIIRTHLINDEDTVRIVRHAGRGVIKVKYGCDLYVIFVIVGGADTPIKSTTSRGN